VRREVPLSVALKISGHKAASMSRRYDVNSEDVYLAPPASFTRDLYCSSSLLFVQ